MQRTGLRRRASLPAPLLAAGLLAAGLLAAGCAATSSSSTRTAGELIVAADAEFDRRAFPAALERYRLAAATADRAGNDAEFAEAAAQVSTVLSLQGLVSEGDAWLARAEERITPDVDGAWTRVLLARGVRDWKRDEPERARSTFVELYNYCFLRERTPRAIQAAKMAALVSRGQEQLDWTRRAIQAAESTGNPKWEAPLWSDLAWLLEERELHAEALTAFARARALTRKAETGRLPRIRADWAYGHGLRLAGENVAARRLLDETLAVTHSFYLQRRTPPAAEYLGRVLRELAELDATEGRTLRALERLAAAREKLVEAGAADLAPELLNEIDARMIEIQSR